MYNRIRLTASEIGSLWTAYMNDSMAHCVLKSMLQHTDDNEIKAVIQSTYNMSRDHLQQLTSLFEQEGFAIPFGFNEQDDVYKNTPWLFSDVFCIEYVNHMSVLSLVAYGGALSMSFREDIRAYFTQCLTQASNLYNQSRNLGLAKGISSRPPYMEVPEEIDYVDNKDYLAGLNPFSEKRPLNAIEISHLHMNTMTNSIGSNLCLAFAQTSPTKDVQDFMLRANKLAKQHIQSFTSTLSKEDVQTPIAADVNISNSTTHTFSDKLMMFHITQIIAAGIGNYATASAASQRLDVTAKYEKLSTDAARVAKSGADIMIKHNWLEEPPGIKNREKLAREKKT